MFEVNTKMVSKLQIHFSNEDQNNFLVSEKCLRMLEEQSDFTILRKIGEGADNIAILALSKSDKKQYVLLLDKNKECENVILPSKGATLIGEMQEKGNLNSNNIVQVYETFTIKNIFLTDDPKYCPEVKSIAPFEGVLVQVEEYIDGITLDEKIFRMSEEDLDDKVNFLIELKNKINELLEYIKRKGLWYQDFNSTNFILRDPDNLDTLTFIDADAFQTRAEGMLNMEKTSEELDTTMRRNLSLDMFGEILDPLTNEESKEKEYKVYREKYGKKAKLFKQHEIGMAFGMIVGEYSEVAKIVKVVDGRSQR